MGQQRLIVWFTWNIMTNIWDVIAKFTIYIHKTLHNITDAEQNKTESGIFRGIRYDIHNTQSHRNNLLKTFVPQFRQLYVKSHWHTHEVNPAQCIPDSKVHGANMGPTWVPSAPDGPHIGPWTFISGWCRQSCLEYIEWYGRFTTHGATPKQFSWGCKFTFY